MTFAQTLQRELDASGWTAADRHFENAVNAAIARDDAAFEREMAAFNRIRASLWPASDAQPLGVTGKPVPAIDAGRDKGGEE